MTLKKPLVMTLKKVLVIDSEEGSSHASQAYTVIVPPKRERNKGRWVRLKRTARQ